MTESHPSSEPATGPLATTSAPPPAAQRSDRDVRRRSPLSTVAAWVGIVAGVVFIVAVVFFSGFILGAHSGGHHGGGRDGHSFGMHHGGPPMFPMGPRGQFERPGAPWGGPGAQPPQSPPAPSGSTTPAVPPRP